MGGSVEPIVAHVDPDGGDPPGDGRGPVKVKETSFVQPIIAKQVEAHDHHAVRERGGSGRKFQKPVF